MRKTYEGDRYLPTQLELPLNQATALRLVPNGTAMEPSNPRQNNVVELKISSMQKLINSMPGIQSVLKRAEGLDW